MNEQQILSELQKDYDNAKIIKQENDEYINKMRNVYEGRLDAPEYGSSFVDRQAFKQVEWFVSQTKNPFISNDSIVRLTSLDQQQEMFTIQSEKLLNHMFVKKFDRYNFVTDLLKVLAIEGTVIVRTGWEYVGSEKEIDQPIVQQDPNTAQPVQVGSVKVTKEIPVINRPTATIVKNEDIYIDPTAYDVKDIQFIIHRREVRLSDLEESGLYKNLDKVKNESVDSLSNAGDSNSVSDYSRQTNTDLNINLDDEPRKKYYMYEYWGNYDLNDDGIAEPIVCCWINDVIVRLEDNPYPDGKIPYIIGNYSREPYSIYGKSLVDLIEDQQRLKTGIIRGILDDIAQSNSRQIGIQKGNLDPVNLRKFYNGEPFEFNLSPNAFYKGQYNRIPGEVFNMLQIVEQDIQVTSGVIPFQGGQGSQSIYGSQAGKAGQMNSMALRELDQVTNIADNIIKPIMRKWLMYCYELLDPKEIEFITKIPYIKPDDLFDVEYYTDFTIDISTQHTDEVKASELAFLLQTLGNNMPIEMTKLLMSKIADLKQMPDLAQSVREYKPQPDPMQQQMQQLQLEKAKLDLQTEQMKAQSEAQYKQAKSKEAESKAQLMGLDGLAKQYGTQEAQKMREIQAQNQAKLDQIREQQRLKQQSQLPSDYGINGATMKQEPMQQPNNVTVI